MGAQNRQYTTAGTQLVADRGVATIAVRGVVTDRVMLSLLSDCDADMRNVRADALVARYDQSALAIDAQGLLASAQRVIRPGEAIAVPTALVVSPDTLDLFRAYAWQMAQRGVVRAVFTSPDAALEWARSEAVAWAAHRAGRRSSR